MKSTGMFVYGAEPTAETSFVLTSKSMQLVEAVFLACLKQGVSFHFVLIDEDADSTRRSVLRVGPGTHYMFRYEGRSVFEQYTGIDKLVAYTVEKNELEVRYSNDLEGGCYVIINTYRIEA